MALEPDRCNSLSLHRNPHRFVWSQFGTAFRRIATAWLKTELGPVSNSVIEKGGNDV
jgi:hypothetical protein